MTFQTRSSGLRSTRSQSAGTLRGSQRGLSHALALLAATAMLVVSVGCVSPTNETGRTNKTAVGGIGGAVAGGLLGEALGGGTEGVLAGVAIGGLLGALGGQVLDQRDRKIAADNAHAALERAPTGTASPWQNPDTGNSGTFTPTRTYQQPSGQYCREYQQEVWVAGQREMAYGTACRQADGSWKMIE